MKLKGTLLEKETQKIDSKFEEQIRRDILDSYEILHNLDLFHYTFIEKFIPLMKFKDRQRYLPFLHQKHKPFSKITLLYSIKTFFMKSNLSDFSFSCWPIILF